MQRLFFHIFLTMFLCAFCGASFAESGPLASATFQPDKEGTALYEAMKKKMLDAGTLSWESEFESRFAGKTVGSGSYKIWLKKPNFARIESKNANGTTGILIGDGQYFWIYWPNKRPRMGFEDPQEYEKIAGIGFKKIRSVPGKHSLAHAFSDLRAGMPMLIMQASLFHGTKDVLEKSKFDGVRLLKREKVGEEMCDLIEASFLDYQRSQLFWISHKDGLPRKIKEIVRTENGIENHEQWLNVTVDAAMDDGKFAWKPPENWKEWFEPQLEDGLIPEGEKAPEFSFETIEGNNFQLSEQLGKMVVLVFWRVGCPPCRQEMPTLEKIHAAYKDKDVVVLGFNVSDQKQFAVDFLKANGVSYPQIIDNSEKAKDVQFKKYQRLFGMSAVPLTYLIASDGRVISSWYGNDPEALTGIIAEKIDGIRRPILDIEVIEDGHPQTTHWRHLVDGKTRGYGGPIAGSEEYRHYSLVFSGTMIGSVTADLRLRSIFKDKDRQTKKEVSSQITVERGQAKEEQILPGFKVKVSFPK